MTYIPQPQSEYFGEKRVKSKDEISHELFEEILNILKKIEFHQSVITGEILEEEKK